MNDDNLLLAVAAIAAVVALANMVIVFQDASGISGYATDNTSEGVANLTVESNVAIEFTDAVINWGAGHHYSGNVSALLVSNTTVVNGTWSPVDEGFRLENLGNVNASINLSAAKNASEFIGGSSAGGPEYQWKISEEETGTCSGTLSDTTFTDVTSVNSTEVCSEMRYTSDEDVLDIDVKIVVPEDASKDVKEDTITATATAI